MDSKPQQSQDARPDPVVDESAPPGSVAEELPPPPPPPPVGTALPEAQAEDEPAEVYEPPPPPAGGGALWPSAAESEPEPAAPPQPGWTRPTPVSEISHIPVAPAGNTPTSVVGRASVRTSTAPNSAHVAAPAVPGTYRGGETGPAGAAPPPATPVPTATPAPITPVPAKGPVPPLDRRVPKVPVAEESPWSGFAVPFNKADEPKSPGYVRPEPDAGPAAPPAAAGYSLPGVESVAAEGEPAIPTQRSGWTASTPASVAPLPGRDPAPADPDPPAAGATAGVVKARVTVPGARKPSAADLPYGVPAVTSGSARVYRAGEAGPLQTGSGPDEPGEPDRPRPDEPRPDRPEPEPEPDEPRPGEPEPEPAEPGRPVPGRPPAPPPEPRPEPPLRPQPPFPGPEPAPGPAPSPFPAPPGPPPGPAPTPPGPSPTPPGPPPVPPSPVPQPPPSPVPPVPEPRPPTPPGPPVPPPGPPPGPSPAPPFPPPPAMAAPPASGAPAPALPSWPESINPTAPGASPAAADYHRWAQGQRAGRLYGQSDEPAQMTTAYPAATLENSGSLTGHILAQGRTETTQARRSYAKVGLFLAVGLGVLIGIGVLVVLFVSNSITGFLD